MKVGFLLALYFVKGVICNCEMFFLFIWKRMLEICQLLFLCKYCSLDRVNPSNLGLLRELNIVLH